MTRFRLTGSTVLLSLSSMAITDSASQVKQFLKLVHVDRLAAPVYTQVQQMLAQCFTQARASENKKAVPERCQVKADAELDHVIGWDKIESELIKLYTTNFTESKLKDLSAFYQLLLGKKVLKKMPRLTAEPAQLTQVKPQDVAKPVNGPMADMDKEFGVAAPIQKKR